MSALDEIKNRVEGHTQGPWVAQNLEREHGHRGIYWVTSEHEGSQVVAEVDANDGGVEAIWRFADAELIAAAPKLLAALEAVEALLSERATGFRETADRLNQQVIDREPGRDAEAANRYAIHAQSSESALRMVQRTITDALA